MSDPRHFTEATITLNGVPLRGVDFQWEPFVFPVRPVYQPGYVRGMFAVHAQMQIAKEAFDRFMDTFALPNPPAFWMTFTPRKPKPPKPTPRQYRLKRRAAGSKRRNKGRR